MDFIEGLPVSAGYNCIFVVVDKFSKFSHFIPLKHSYTAHTVAKVFMQQVYRLHGMPSVIISDRDKIFTSNLWRSLFTMAGVSLQMSSAYHPQSDGQTERVNQCLETFLRCFVHACPTKWMDWIYLAEFWYNSSWHSALGHTPFQVLYGYSPRHFGLDSLDTCSTPSLADWLEDKVVMQKLIQQHLVRAQQRMKFHADKKRSDRVFAVGDLVYIKLQPYVQSSLAPRSNQKLAFKYFGPFPILSRVGSVAYKLQLPPSSSIHPVLHVSQLKRALAPSETTAELPDRFDELQVPVKILRRRLGAEGSYQVLVQWSGLSPSLATWEDVTHLQQRFPQAPAWGQAGFLHGGNVSKEMVEDGPRHETTHGPRHSKRARAENVRLKGPEWVS
jgi:hypothetical protein